VVLCHRLLDKIQPRHDGHTDVRDHNIRVEGLHFFHALSTVGCLLDLRDAHSLPVHRADQPLPDHDLVLHDQQLVLHCAYTSFIFISTHRPPPWGLLNASALSALLMLAVFLPLVCVLWLRKIQVKSRLRGNAK